MFLLDNDFNEDPYEDNYDYGHYDMTNNIKYINVNVYRYIRK